ERGRELTQWLLLGEVLAGALVAVLARLLEERVRAREVLRQRSAERVVDGELVAGRGHAAVAGLLEEGRGLAEVPGQDRGVAVLIEPGEAEAVVPEAPVAGARVERLGLDEVGADHPPLSVGEREPAAAVELAAVAGLLVERLHARGVGRHAVAAGVERAEVRAAAEVLPRAGLTVERRGLG